MWIPRPIYEAMPYVLAGAGAGLVALAFHAKELPHGLLFGGGGILLTAGLVLWMKRRDYRTTQSDYDPGSLDE
jgi:hypothetical protein